jgi:DNA-binding XRE family transcriptional regulator
VGSGEGAGARCDARRGAAEWWVFSSACISVASMGHARTKPKRLAQKLLQIRVALGLSQWEMAERLGVERSYNIISKYERDRSVPYIEVVLAYARAANVEMAQIVDDELDLNLNL